MSTMPKINLTNKPTSEQVRILKDYLSRRSQHDGQGDIKLSQVVKRFKHKSLMSDKDKMAHFRKLLRLASDADKTKKEEKN
jgi:hypothetical protein